MKAQIDQKDNTAFLLRKYGSEISTSHVGGDFQRVKSHNRRQEISRHEAFMDTRPTVF